MATRLENQIKRYYTETVRAFLTLIEEKDPSIRAHCERVARLCGAFCKMLGITAAETQKISLAGMLHDIGLLYVPSELLQKPEPLTDGDTAVIQTHPVLAEKIVSQLSFLAGIVPIVRHHHERVDGTGYPDKLAGDAIPVGARILALADSYDAMISGYPYRQARTEETARGEIRGNAGSQFDQKLAAAFLEFLTLRSAAEATTALSSEKQKRDTLGTIAQQIILRFREGRLQLPVLPKVIMEIQKTIRNPIATTDDIAKIIERDAVISLRLITIANSVTYRGVERVQTVRQAVPRLGIKQTQSVVSTIGNKWLYTSATEDFAGLMEKLWAHSLATAHAARAIGAALQHPDIERLYLMGLFHDIGKALLLRGMDIVATKLPSFTVAELTAVVQEHHTAFGSIILQHWGFDEEIVRIAKMHDDEKFFPATQREIIIVSLANLLTRAIGFSLFNDAQLDPGQLEQTSLLGVDAAALTAVREETVEKMNQTSNIF